MREQKIAAPADSQPTWGAFGYIGGQLIRADWHHQGIMAALIQNGWTWEDLFTAPQAWGWYNYWKNEDRIGLRFTSDSGKQHPQTVTEAKAAFMRLYNCPASAYHNPHLPASASEQSEANDYQFGRGLSGRDLRDVGADRGRLIAEQINDPLPPPPKTAGVMKNPDWPFISFIYDDQENDLWILEQGNNHDEIIADRFGEENVYSTVLEMMGRGGYVFGVVWMDGQGIDLNYSDLAGTVLSEDVDSHPSDYHQEGKILERAKSAIIDWLQANDWSPEDLGLKEGYVPDWYEEPNPDQLSMTAGGWGETAQGRIVWVIDPETDELLVSGPQMPISHQSAFPQIGWNSNGSGDVLLFEDGSTISHLFHLEEDLTKWTSSDILHEITAYVAEHAPSYSVAGIIDTRKIKQGAILDSSSGAFPHTQKEIGGYTVIEMNSDEYPRHEALLIDRRENVIIINYNGHHDPIFQNWHEFYTRGGMEFVTGHFRLEPSRTEPFSEGWGWHHNHPTDDELEIISSVLKEHYGVENLEDAYIVPEEDGAVEGELFQGGPWGPPKVAHFDFLENKDDEGLNRPKPWMAFYKAATDHLLVTHDLTLNLEADARVRGFYTKVERSEGENASRARELAEEALKQFYTAAANPRTANGDLYRWIIDKDGKVSIGKEQSHSDLIEAHYGKAAAEAYDDRWEEIFDTFVTGGYIWNGEVQVIRTNGEREFDPEDIGRKVWATAHTQGIVTNDEILYRDDTRQGSPVRYFSA